jgi:hypothetical protein
LRDRGIWQVLSPLEWAAGLAVAERATDVSFA